MKKLLAAIAVASLALTACGSSQTDPNDDDTFTVGMECNYAPFNWQTKDKTSTSVSLGDGAGYCDGYDVIKGAIRLSCPSRGTWIEIPAVAVAQALLN